MRHASLSCVSWQLDVMQNTGKCCDTVRGALVIGRIAREDQWRGRRDQISGVCHVVMVHLFQEKSTEAADRGRLLVLAAFVAVDNH